MFLKRLKDAESAVLVNGSILIKLLSRSFSYQARIQNEFDINLDTLAGGISFVRRVEGYTWDLEVLPPFVRF